MFYVNIHFYTPNRREQIFFKKIIIIYNKSTDENKDDFGLATEIKIHNKCLFFLNGFAKMLFITTTTITCQ